jgi:hypothetical protein
VYTNHICSLTVWPSTVRVLILKSTPIVGMLCPTYVCDHHALSQPSHTSTRNKGRGLVSCTLSAYRSSNDLRAMDHHQQQEGSSKRA